MEVEESEVRKPKGRGSRFSSKDLKSEKANMKERNGDTGGDISDLPNGEAPAISIKKEVDSIDVEEHGFEEDSSGNIRPVTVTCPSQVVEKSEKEFNSHSIGDKKVHNEDTSVKKGLQPTVDDSHGLGHNDEGEEEEDFCGFKEGEDANSTAEVFAQIIGDCEKSIATMEAMLSEERDHLGRGYRSGTNSPMKIDGLNEVLGGDEMCSSNASSPSVASGFSGEGRTHRGKKSQHIDLSSPAFRKPLEMGWKRELVYRNTADSTQKRMADVYYYTPMGKKVRSAREVLEHLPGTDLSDENFTFFKMALGINDPTKEIIRDAKRGPLREASGTPPHKVPKISNKSSPKPEGVKLTTPAKDDTGSSPKTPKNFSRGAFPRIKVSSTKPTLQMSPSKPKQLGRPKKDPPAIGEGELEMGMLPPSWKEPSAISGTRKSTPPATPTSGANLWTPSPTKEDGMIGTSQMGMFMQQFAQNMNIGYNALRQAFEYLKVHELLRAARVCRMWHDLAEQPYLWRTVRMKNSQVLDWDGAAATLSSRSTRHLDLRKMLLDPNKSSEMWTRFCGAIGRISSLRHLDLCRCPASVVERVAVQCPQLTNLNALSIQDSTIDLKAFNSMSQLEELRLKGTNGLKLKTTSLDMLANMTALRHLSLTMVKDLGKANLEIVQSMVQLETLELGECCDFPESFGMEYLPRLTRLTRLRLEKGAEGCPTFAILAGVKSLPLLTLLELVNFDIKPGFDQALAECTNIQRLLIIPTYLSQSATTNHMVLGGVTKLSGSLTQFVWGITHELLHVTELFVDQCEGQKGGAPKGALGTPGGAGGAGGKQQQPSGSGKKNTSDSIPVLRPVPGKDELGVAVKAQEEDTSKPSPQVDILPLSQLQKLLTNNLPGTKVSILKIPFNATWRQTLGEINH